MKFAPAGVPTFLVNNNVFWKADLYTLTLIDGTIFRWTTADFNITVSGNTWTSGVVLRRDGLRQSLTLEVDTLQITFDAAATMLGKTIAQQTVLGVLDDARLQLDRVVGATSGDVSLGVIPGWFEGRVAGIDPNELEVSVGLRSDLEILSMLRLPKFTFTPMCAHAVYDANCTLNKATFTIAGTASGVPTTSTIPTTTAGLTAKAAGYFNRGVMVFTSGALIGVRRAVSDWTANTFTVAMPLPSAPAAGDAFTVYPGCKRDAAECGPAKFNNLVNFRGFISIPSTEGGS